MPPVEEVFTRQEDAWWSSNNVEQIKLEQSLNFLPTWTLFASAPVNAKDPTHARYKDNPEEGCAFVEGQDAQGSTLRIKSPKTRKRSFCKEAESHKARSLAGRFCSKLWPICPYQFQEPCLSRHARLICSQSAEVIEQGRYDELLMNGYSHKASFLKAHMLYSPSNVDTRLADEFSYPVQLNRRETERYQRCSVHITFRTDRRGGKHRLHKVAIRESVLLGVGAAA